MKDVSGETFELSEAPRFELICRAHAVKPRKKRLTTGLLSHYVRLCTRGASDNPLVLGGTHWWTLTDTGTL